MAGFLFQLIKKKRFITLSYIRLQLTEKILYHPKQLSKEFSNMDDDYIFHRNNLQ